MDKIDKEIKDATLIAAASELLRECIYALNELKHPHPNPENRKLTIAGLENIISKVKEKK